MNSLVVETLQFGSLILNKKSNSQTEESLQPNYSVWEFNFKQKIFTKLLIAGESPPPFKRRNHTAIVYKDSMYVFGGFSDVKKISKIF